VKTEYNAYTPSLPVGDTQMGRVWGNTPSIILQSFCSIKCQTEYNAYTPSLPVGTNRRTPFYSLFRDKLSLPRELVQGLVQGEMLDYREREEVGRNKSLSD
jgi:hypothetical protein